jgi:hypothetical protein
MPENGQTYHFTQHDIEVGSDMATTFGQYVGAFNTTCRASVQISCHDTGKTHNTSGNYFVVKGSRALLGYQLLSPFIVVMMGGEEFDTDEHELPHSSRGHYGFNTACNAADPPNTTDKCTGMSYWLYGAMIQREHLRDAQIAMRNDTKAILSLRSTHSDTLHTDLCTTRLIGVKFHPAAVGYSPFIRFNPGQKAVVVSANPDTNTTLVLTVAIGGKLEEMGFNRTGCFTVEDEYQGRGKMEVRAADLANWSITIAADKQARGGLSVLVVRPVSCSLNHIPSLVPLQR